MRSKHFLSSGLGFTWQVRRLSFTGCLLDCKQRTDAGSHWSGNTPSRTSEHSGDPRSEIPCGQRRFEPLQTPAAAPGLVGSGSLSAVSCQQRGQRRGRGGGADDRRRGCDDPLELHWLPGNQPSSAEVTQSSASPEEKHQNKLRR